MAEAVRDQDEPEARRLLNATVAHVPMASADEAPAPPT
jgi:hypothetical protein